MGDHEEVICPNCQNNLLRKQRTGRRCSACHKTFALEPKEDPFGMHDERMRRLVDKLRDGQGLYYTGRQLYYAAGRKYLPSLTETWRTAFVVLVVLVFAGAIVCVPVAGAVSPKSGLPLFGLALIVLAALMFLVRPWFIRQAAVRMTHDYERFRTGVLDVWQRHYGARPPGEIPDDLPLPVVERPRMALLCPDRAALSCLAANGATGVWGMALCERLDQLPPTVPVLILHDAAVPGVDYAHRVRGALGPRAIPIGLTPAMVRTAGSATKLRERAVPDAPLPSSWSEDDRRWLREGWWTPLCALPPARLLAVVRGGVDRIEMAAAPEHRAARRVGFLTWPSS